VILAQPHGNAKLIAEDLGRHRGERGPTLEELVSVVGLVEVVKGGEGFAHPSRGAVEKRSDVVKTPLIRLEEEPPARQRLVEKGTTIATIPLATTLMIATASATPPERSHTILTDLRPRAPRISQ
jgi:hypothetical protein